MATDAHTHLLPERLARKIRAYFDALIPGELAYTLKPEELLDTHAAAGFDTIWTLPYAHKPGMADALNDSMADLAISWSTRGVEIINGCTVHVADDDPAATLTRAVEQAEAMVCKLHCSVGDYEPDDSRFDEFWTEAASLKIPVVVHAGHATSGHTEAAELDPVERVATAHPEARIIIAHCGHRAWEEALGLIERHTNVYADLTPVTRDPIPLEIEHYERFADRLLFGSDAPNVVISAADNLTHVTTGVSDSAKQKILSGNATRLIERS